MTQLFQSEAAGAFGNSATDLITMKGYTVSHLKVPIIVTRIATLTDSRDLQESVAAFTANAKVRLPKPAACSHEADHSHFDPEYPPHRPDARHRLLRRSMGTPFPSHSARASALGQSLAFMACSSPL
jgi:hypothetical protein